MCLQNLDRCGQYIQTTFMYATLAVEELGAFSTALQRSSQQRLVYLSPGNRWPLWHVMVAICCNGLKMSERMCERMRVYLPCKECANVSDEAHSLPGIKPDDLLTGKHRECRADSSHRNAGSKRQTRRLLVSEFAHGAHCAHGACYRRS